MRNDGLVGVAGSKRYAQAAAAPRQRELGLGTWGRSVCVLTLLSLSLSSSGRSLAVGRALKPDSSLCLSFSSPLTGGVHACACASQNERKHVLRTGSEEEKARQPLPPSPAPWHARLAVVPRGRASSIDIPCVCVCACELSHRRSSAQLSLFPPPSAQHLRGGTVARRGQIKSHGLPLNYSQRRHQRQSPSPSRLTTLLASTFMHAPQRWSSPVLT